MIEFLSIGDAIKKLDIKGRLFPVNVVDILVQLTATLIAVFLLAKFLWKPAKRYIAKRKEYVESNIQGAKEKNEEAAKLLEEAETERADANNEAKTIVEDAKKEAEIKAAEIIAKANQTAKDKMNQAELEIAHAKEEAAEDVRKQIIDVAILAAGAVSEKNVDNAENKKFVEDFIKDIDQ